MQQIKRKISNRTLALLSMFLLPLALVVGIGGASAASAASSSGSAVTSSSLGTYSPTFVGPAATGCDSAGCDLLTGPTATPSTAGITTSSAPPGSADNPQSDPDVPLALRTPVLSKDGPDPTPPAVSCEPRGPGCDKISTNSGGATGVQGLNAVESASQSTNVEGIDIEPADQGLCAGNGYVVEDNNIGEVQIFNNALHKVSPVLPLDTIMGLTAKGWSSGGDISCTYDYANGGHWFFTEIVSGSSEANGGAFTGCFAAAAACYEGIAVTKGNNPFGPYNVYFLNANYNPQEPGYPTLFNDFAKIATTRDAFEVFYDEFPNSAANPGIGGGFFNGAQQFAFSKNAFERGLSTTLPNGDPNPAFTVAIENMGTLPTPDGTCASDNTFHEPGITCWYAAIPATVSDPSQYDNSHGGSGFIMDTLDYYGAGDTRLAIFDWTGLKNLNSPNCSACSGIHFGGQLFSGVDYYYGEGFIAPQKAGPTPLGDECGAAGLSVATSTSPAPASCPEGGIATNGDFMTQVAQAQGQIWGATSTEIDQTYSSESSPEVHQGAIYWVVGTNSFDRTGVFSLTSEGYVSPEHEDLEFPAIAASDFPGGGAIMTFTLSGNGGPNGADHGGFYPSTAFIRMSSSGIDSPAATVNIADLGQSPQDGFTEYQGLPGPTRPRWGDYSNAVYDPQDGEIYFATNYIQSPNCTGSAFTLTLGTCGGTRDGFANWGTSVNSVRP